MNKCLRHSLLLLLFAGLSFQVVAQEQKRTRIKINQADKAYYKKNKDKSRLIGNVILEHEGALMYCDSAWNFGETNSMKAYSNVRINQGDTLFLWGDYLEYNGNTRQALVTGDSVRLEDDEVKLTTDRINLNRKTNVAYYTTGGHILNDENVLVSEAGYYNTSSKVFVFQQDVVLTNPRYVIESDTLRYDSEARFAYFEGPTTITSDSSLIYTEKGVYNTVQDIAQFEKNTYLYDDNKVLSGDSMYYEKTNDFGEVFGNLFLHDTVDNYIISGQYGQYLGSIDSTFVTDNPVYSLIDQEDTLHVHGDTLLSSMSTDTLNQEYRQLRIYRGVRFFKRDLQGACDSLTYSTADSAFKMFYTPVTWNDSTQITGDTIFMTTRNDKLDSLKVFGNGFIVSIVDDDKTNQIKGKTIYGQFSDNALKRVYVNGNGQSLYYARKEDKSYIGLNRSLSSFIIIKFKNKQVDSIGFLKKPEAILYPMKDVTPDLSKLEGLQMRFDERPTKKSDIFK